MSVPLDRLYNFLEGLCNHPLIIYRWTPHGSKKPEDCKELKEYKSFLSQKEFVSSLFLFCHDQEPLDFNSFEQPLSEFNIPGVEYSVLRMLPLVPPYLLNDKLLLLHSEKNSAEVEKFKKNGAIPVYYWSHALISLDWYRYANVDPELENASNFRYDFLIYNRAWSGSREYRLKFSELVVANSLTDCCYMNFSKIDNGVHYTQHKFKNKNFSITNHSLEDYFVQNSASSCYSADYSAGDYNQCRIDVVLETLFDDERIHLTEKTLRPIACGKPFIILGPCGSLEYLKSYGFKTYKDFINEDYDKIMDPAERLNAVIKSMKEFNNLDADTKNQLYGKMQEISDYNKKRFFSNEFFNLIVDEFKNNMQCAVDEFNKTNTTEYIIRAAKLSDHSDDLPYLRIEYKSIGELLHKIKQENN